MDISRKMKSVVADTGKQVKNLVVSTLGTEDLLWENEVLANKQVGQVLLLSAIIMMLSFLLDLAGVYHIDLGVMTGLTVVNLIILLIPYLICRRLHGENKNLKLLMLFCLVISFSLTDMLLAFNVSLIMAIPVVLSSRYYRRRLTAFIALVTTITFTISSVLSFYWGIPDLNRVTIQPGTVLSVETNVTNAIMNSSGLDLGMYRSSLFWRGFIPKYFLFILIAVVSAEIAHRGHAMVRRQADVAREHARIDTELNVAREIQKRALPIVHDLKEHPAFDLAASMEPAKEIGGDFYDFVMIDDTHLALVIADVSGKGVPAAMFMMVSKLLLDIALSERKQPGVILAEVNHLLCEKDLDDMFVTVWLGMIDLETGHVVSANAGHEYPLIKRKGGSFEVLKDRHGLVIGGMDGVRYRETEFTLEPGDILFVYTDGVTEANNADQALFGLDAVRKALDESPDETMQGLLAGLKARTAVFVGETEQFDDITMMGFKLNHLLSVDGITLAPTPDSVPKVQEYLESQMEQGEIPQKLMYKMNIAIDEIYSNIVKYSRASWVNAVCTITDEKLQVRFRDNGIPYDPLAQADPDITGSAEEREIGGLGIFMTRKLMNEFTYVCEKGVNVTTLGLQREGAK